MNKAMRPSGKPRSARSDGPVVEQQKIYAWRDHGGIPPELGNKNSGRPAVGHHGGGTTNDDTGEPGE